MKELEFPQNQGNNLSQHRIDKGFQIFKDEMSNFFSKK